MTPYPQMLYQRGAATLSEARRCVVTDESAHAVARQDGWRTADEWLAEGAAPATPAPVPPVARPRRGRPPTRRVTETHDDG